MSRWARARAFLRARYLTIDPRVAGIFRILLGGLLTLDALRHWGERDLLYSIDGVFPNDFHLFKPTSGFLFSVFHSFSTPRELDVLFALGIVCHLLMLVGYRARLFAVLGFLWVTSRDSRIPLVENGGYVVENLACLWACFLPIERRFGVDAWLASWRARKETTLAELEDRADVSNERTPTVSLAGFVVLFNLLLVYFFNVVNKTGHIWRKGETVHYVLHIDRMVTGLAVFVREHLPEWAMKPSSWGVLSIEAMIFVCIASPYARRYTRPLAMAMMAAIHGTFGTFMRLGPFSWTLITWSTLLLRPVHLDGLKRLALRGRPRIVLGVDVGAPLPLAVARAMARLDGEDRRVRIVPPPEGAALAVRDDVEGTSWSTEPDAIIDALLDVVPLARAGWAVLRVVSLGAIPALARRALAHPDATARYLGLDTLPRPSAPPAAPLFARLARARSGLREALVGYLLFCAILQAYWENKAIPKALPPPIKEGQVLQPDEKIWLDRITRWLGGRVITLKPEPAPTFLRLTTNYPRTFQGWGMFSPNPISDDGVLAIDAYTLGGRRVDPLTGKTPDLDLTDSRGEGLSQLRQDYGNRIRLDRNQAYRDKLRDYLLRYHERTGRPDDEVVAFDVYWVRDKCPKPGSDRPYDGEAVPIYTWRKPKYVAPLTGVRIPPSPKVRSAEKPDEKKATDPAP